MAKKLKGLEETSIYDDLGRRYMPGGWWGDWADRTQQGVEDQSQLIMGQDPNNYPQNQPYYAVPDSAYPDFSSKAVNVEPNAISLIKKYFPPSEWERAYAVMMSESGGQNIPSVFNQRKTEDSHGLFQINLDAHPEMATKVYDPEENVKFAAQLWRKQGWKPWGGYTSGGYTRYLTEASQVMNAPQQGGFTNTANKFIAALTPKTAHASEGEFPVTQSYSPSNTEVNTQSRYTVKKNDTLWDLSNKFLGSGQRWKELIGYTGDPRKMPIGTKISIPPITGIQPGTRGIPRVTPAPPAITSTRVNFPQPSSSVAGPPTPGFNKPVPRITQPKPVTIRPNQPGLSFSNKIPVPTRNFISGTNNPIAKYFQPNTLGGFKI